MHSIKVKCFYEISTNMTVMLKKMKFHDTAKGKAVLISITLSWNFILVRVYWPLRPKVETCFVPRSSKGPISGVVPESDILRTSQ